MHCEAACSQQSAASCQRSLREQNTTCPLYLPLTRQHRASVQLEPPPSTLSHPNLNCSLSAVFLFDVFFSPTSFFFLPKVPLVAFDLKVKDSMQLLQVTSRFLWEIKMCSVPGTTVVMRPDNPSPGLRLKLDFLPDNVAVVAREECGHQIIDSVYMWWGAEVTISLSLCLHCLSLSPLSPLSAIVWLLVSSVSECRQIDRRQAGSGGG